MIQIDGSYLEGGGQILRIATALSVITQKPVRVFNIRKKRPKPGLMTQHLLGLQALISFCQGKLEGAQIGSREIKFYPDQLFKNRLSIQIPTAGSITLILQSLLPVILFAPFPVTINFRGGATDTFFSPTIDYFRFVFLRILEKFGVKAGVKIIRRGFYPQGGAQVEVTVWPGKLTGINLTERRELKRIFVLSGASEGLKKQKVAERQIFEVRKILNQLNQPFEEKIEYYSQTTSTGSQINIIAEFEKTIIGVDNLGKLGKPAEQVGKEAIENFLKEIRSNACLDKHMADQILIFMSLTNQRSVVTVSEITNHCKTSIWVIEKFLSGSFEIKENKISWLPG